MLIQTKTLHKSFVFIIWIFCSCSSHEQNLDKSNSPLSIALKGDVKDSIPQIEDEPIEEPIGKSTIAHAIWQTSKRVVYDPSYVKLKYPGGDVSADKGVCTDVIIRAYRSIGQDLQVLIRDYMLELNQPSDKNIDHRRCSTLKKYFAYKGLSLPVSDKDEDYHPGDIVFWDIAAGHVGLVTDQKVPGTNRYMVVHNICCGPQLEDFLFRAKIVMHVRWIP